MLWLLVGVFAHLCPVVRLLGCLCSSEHPRMGDFCLFSVSSKKCSTATAPHVIPAPSLLPRVFPHCISCSLWKPPLKSSARGMETCHIPKIHLETHQGGPRCSKASSASGYSSAPPGVLLTCTGPCAVHELCKLDQNETWGSVEEVKLAAQCVGMFLGLMCQPLHLPPL